VFCAGEEVAYAMSLAIRADREQPAFQVEEDRATSKRRRHP